MEISQIISMDLFLSNNIHLIRMIRSILIRIAFMNLIPYFNTEAAFGADKC